MKAMILAAGRGSRMRELTDNIPKPLLKVGGKTLIESQIEKLQLAGISEVVINLGYLGQKIKEFLGNGEKYKVSIRYSTEPETGLETGGGVFQALSLLGDSPFILTNADVFTNYDYRQLLDKNVEGIHLVLVNNPDFKNKGDFGLNGNAGSNFSQLTNDSDYTFSGISIINPAIFKGKQAGVFPIAPLFRDAIIKKVATGELYTGIWNDVGTPERLNEANQSLSN